MRQQSLALGRDHKRRREHGGGVRAGQRKLYRPFDPRRPIHVTLRSGVATGSWSMLRTHDRERAISRLVYLYAHKNGVRVHKFANVGNHLHLLVSAQKHDGFKDFLRTVGALVPRLVTGARKGRSIASLIHTRIHSRSGAQAQVSDRTASHSGNKFWDTLAHSRVVDWGRDFENTVTYVLQNMSEAAGMSHVSGRRVAPRQIRPKPT